MLPHRLALVGVIAGLTAGGPAVAHAQPQFVDPERPAEPRHDMPPGREPRAPLPSATLRVDLGVASPVGMLGLVYSRPVAPWLALEPGVGFGMSGLQLSTMAKLTFGRGRTRFTPGAGVSVGIPVTGGATFHTGHPAGDDEVRGDALVMPWLDVDLLGVEHRTAAGFVVTASAGVTFALRGAHWDAIDLGGDIQPFELFPQLRVGVGRAL